MHLFTVIAVFLVTAAPSLSSSPPSRPNTQHLRHEYNGLLDDKMAIESATIDGHRNGMRYAMARADELQKKGWKGKVFQRKQHTLAKLTRQQHEERVNRHTSAIMNHVESARMRINSLGWIPQQTKGVEQVLSKVKDVYEHGKEACNTLHSMACETNKLHGSSKLNAHIHAHADHAIEAAKRYGSAEALRHYSEH